MLVAGCGAWLLIAQVNFTPLNALDVPWFAAGYDVLAAVFAAGVILSLDKHQEKVCSLFVVRRVLGPLGLISYGFYLWHYFAIPFAGFLSIPANNDLFIAAFYSAFTFALATVSWFLIEKPSRALRYRVS